MTPEMHYTLLILDQDADGNRSYEIRTSATATIDPGDEALIVLGPVPVGPGQPYPDDPTAAKALAEAHSIDLDDPATWSAFFEETLEDEGIVII
jgi:hypothetical protein